VFGSRALRLLVDVMGADRVMLGSIRRFRSASSGSAAHPRQATSIPRRRRSFGGNARSSPSTPSARLLRTDAVRDRGGPSARIRADRCGQGDSRWIVFLHEGLGSVAMWRDFPARLAATGARGLVYSRYGMASRIR
jgi:hypothetical protein